MQMRYTLKQLLRVRNYFSANPDGTFQLPGYDGSPCITIMLPSED